MSEQESGSWILILAPHLQAVWPLAAHLTSLIHIILYLPHNAAGKFKGSTDMKMLGWGHMGKEMSLVQLSLCLQFVRLVPS